MAYDQELDDRVAEIAYPWGATRKKMFGGTGYLVNGNMMAGVHGEHLILRLGAEDEAIVLQRPSAGPFDLTGRPMAGWVRMEKSGIEDDRDLEDLLMMAHMFATSLAPK